MAPRSGDSTSHIGEILVEERTRQGLDLGVMEERTKIRSKYLRALENEEWDVLPGPAYVRGWLRTYAGELGLDADGLVDAYRSAYEEPDTQAIGVADPLLGGRIARDRPRVNRLIVVLGLVVAVAALLLVLGLTGGSDEPTSQREAKRHAGGKHGDHGKHHKQPVPDTVELKVSARSDSEVCLVNKGEAVLLDNQLMSDGDEESYEADAFTLSLGFGVLDVSVNGKHERLETTEDEPLTWEVAPRGVREPVADADPDCP